jgi:acetyltransferase-like isoleucine patch superfamily enzyme
VYKKFERIFLTKVLIPLRIYKSRSFLSRRSRIYFERSVSFDRWCYFTARGGEIYIGHNTSLNTQVILNADVGGKIYISNDCLIGPKVIFRTANHKFEKISNRKKGAGHTFGDIFVGKNVWIGANVTILAGVKIGENSVVAAGAVVNRDIPKNCLAVGVPAKVKKYYA